MVLTDRLNTFTIGDTLANDLTALTAGTSVLGDVIDLGQTTNYIGDGEQIYLVIECTTQIITGGSAGTIQFFLVSDAASTLGSATLASCTEHARSLALVTDDSTAIAAGIEAGTATYLPNIAPNTAQTGITEINKVVNRPPILCIPLPLDTYERYLGILCTIGTTTVTAGAVNAFLCKDAPQRYRAYANGI